MSINNIDNDHQVGNIGYWVRESCQNQGIATMGVNLIQQWGFKTLGLVRLEIVVLEENTASRRIAKKCGFTFEVIAKNRIIHKGKPMPAVIYSKIG